MFRIVIIGNSKNISVVLLSLIMSGLLLFGLNVRVCAQNHSDVAKAIDCTSVLNGGNLYLYDNEVWGDKGQIERQLGWSRTPLIEIDRIFDVSQSGIIIDGRAYGNKDYQIPSVVFFDNNKVLLDSLTNFRVLTSGMGDYIPADSFYNKGACYVAFNTYSQYYKYITIKGYGLEGMQRIVKEISSDIDEIKMSTASSGGFFYKLFTKDNPDKNATIDDYISNKEKVSNEAKALFFQLLELKNEGYFLWGQQDDFTLVLTSGGKLIKNSMSNPLYCKRVKGKWVAKRIDEIKLKNCNTMLRGGRLPSVAGIDLSIYINPYLRGDFDNASFGRATLIGLIKKYYDDTKGVVCLSMHPLNPYGGEYNTFDEQFPDAFSQIVEDNPIDGGKAKLCFEKIVFCIKDLLSELKDQEGRYIPIVFRPFHERLEYTGVNGFWWNYSSDDEYIKVYRRLVDSIREDYTNVLFVYNPNLGINVKTISKNEFLRAYPGDNYIDLMGIDIYEERIKAVGGLNNLVNLLRAIDNISASLGKIHIIPEIGNKKGEIPGFYNQLPRFIDAIGIVPIIMTWNNQSKEYWFTPYDESTEYYKEYESFLKRNRLYLPN